jgi:hypothetical protein
VQSQDANSNAATVLTSTQVSLSSSSGSLLFYSDASCSTLVTFTTIAASTSTTNFYFRDSAVGNPQITATASGLGNVSQIETVNPAVPTKLVMITPTRTVAAGACSGTLGAVTVQAQNNNSVASNVTTDTTATLTSTSGTTFYSDSGCTTAITSITITTGTSTASFYFKDNVAGNPTLTATPPVLTPAAQAETITPAAANALVFTNAPITITAGNCSATALTLQVRDSFGNDTTVAGNTTVNLTSGSGALSYFSDSGCTAPITQVVIASGSGLQTAYFKATASGTTTANATSAPLVAGAQNETVNPGPANTLAITSAAQTIAAGQCSNPVTLRTRDSFGNFSNVNPALTVNLGGTTFYSDVGCTQVATTVSVPINTSTATFYFKQNAAGSPTVTANATSFAGTSQGETINPANPTRLVFLVGAQSVQAGVCSPSQVNVQTQDAFSNPSNVTSLTTVTLTPTGTITFYSDAGCTTTTTTLSYAIGSNTRGFWFKSNTVGSPQVAVSATSYTGASQTETISAAAPNKLVFTNAPITVGTGACSTAATVRVQDAFGNFANVTSAQSMGLSSNPPTLTFYSDSGCNTVATSVTIPINSSTAPPFYFKTNTAGTPQVTAAVGGLTSALQTETVSSGGPVVLAFNTGAQTANAGQCSSSAVQIQTRDAFGNPSNVASNTAVTLSATSMTFYTGAGCGSAPVTSVTVLGGANTASFYFKDNTAGGRDVSLSSSGYSGATQTETINPGTAAALVFTNSPLSATAGSCSQAASLQVRDSFGNNTTVSGTTLITMGGSNLSWFTDSGCTLSGSTFNLSGGTGTATVYFRSTVAGTPTATADGSGLSQATQGETVTAGSPTVLAFTTSAQTLGAGNCSNVATIQSRDVNGNASNVSNNTTVTLGGPSGVTFYADSGCSSMVNTVTLPQNGNTASFYFKDTVAGSRQISASSPGFTTANQTESISAGTAAKLTYTTAAQTVLASSCAAVTVQVSDAYDNPTTAGATVTVTAGATATDLSTSFYSDSTCSTAATGVTIGSGSSSGTFYFKTLTGGGSATLTASSGTLTNAVQTETVVATVRTNTCTINAGSTNTGTSCSFNPPVFNMNRTLLFFQATSSAADGQDANVRCYLNTASQIYCDRQGTTTSIQIRWQLAEFPNVASSPLVRHMQQACAGSTSTFTLTAPTNPPVSQQSDSFILFASTRASTNGQTVASSRTARFTSNSQVSIDFNSGSCGADQYAIQVVEWPSATVAAGSTGTQSSFPVSVALTSIDTTRTFLLATSRSGDDPVCSRAVKPFIAGAGTVNFSRNAGLSCANAAVDDIQYQRVQLPSGNVVQQVPFSLAAGASSAAQSITAVDLTRTVIFSGQMMTGGTAFGETANGGELFGEALGRFSFLSSTLVQVQRDANVSAAAFTGWAVQFQP